MLDVPLLDVCQGFPGCPPGFPLVGVVAPPACGCIAYRLPGWMPAPCLPLGGVVPFGILYAHRVTFPGEASALAFTCPAPYGAAGERARHMKARP